VRGRLALFLVVGSLLTSGCGRSDGKHYGTVERAGKDPHAFYVNNHSEPEYLDPGLSTESAGSTLLSDLFEGLVVIHPKTLVPHQGGATHWEQTDDNRLFRFHLRREAKWSDGKPVVAADYVYSWQRVLTAKTGARMATLMYPIKNGKLFHQGRLKVANRDVALRDGTGPGSEKGVAKGSVVKLLKSVRVNIRRPVQAAPLGPEQRLSYNAKSGELTTATGTVAGDTLSEPVSAEVIALGSETTCNEAPDHWYRLETSGGQGWLPGCAIENDSKSTEVLVEVFDDLPTFSVDASAREGDAIVKSERVQGFMPAAALTLDPAVVGVRAVGNHVIEVELEEPTPYFIELVAYVTYYPVRRDLLEHFEEKKRPDLWYRPENIITNGPYTLDEHKFRYEITFKRNPHYYEHDKLKLHRIVFMAVPDYNATLALYKTGEIDYIGQNVSLPATQMKRLEGMADFDRAQWLATYWYAFNVDKPPVNDVRVRRALNLAVDKQQIVDKVTRAGQQPATHFVPDFTGSGYAEAAKADAKAGRARFSGKGHDHDPELARKLLADAGYDIVETDQGFHANDFPALEILYNTAEGHRRIAVAIQSMWKQNLGISVQLRNEEWKVMLKNLRDGRFQVARFGWVADYNHPHTWHDVFLSYSNNNWTRWGDPKYDALVELAAATAEQRKSIDLYRDAEEMLVAAMPRMPLYFYTKSTLIKPYVKGYYPNGANKHRIRWMWIDPGWKTNSDNVPAYPPRAFPEPGSFSAP